MELFPPQSTPAPLYRRGLELGLLPRRLPDLAPYALPRFYYEDGPTLYRHGIALLAAADLTLEQRDAVERGELAHAQRVSGHPLQGAEAYAELVPVLSPQRQNAAREAAQPVLKQVERYVSGRDWSAPYGRLLRYRDFWRVLAPRHYADWLRQQLDTLLRFNAWSGTPAEYRESLAHLHLLEGDEARRGLALALEGASFVSDGEISEDREWAFAGGRIYSDAMVRAAERAAQIEALAAVAPFLPSELHARARALAVERDYTLGDVLGSRSSAPMAMHSAPWYYEVPGEPLPWLTPAERQPAFAALDDAERAALIDTFVDGYVRLGQEFLSDLPRRGVSGDPVAARFRRFVDDDVPVAAPYLTAEQLSRVLALYRLP